MIGRALILLAIAGLSSSAGCLLLVLGAAVRFRLRRSAHSCDGSDTRFPPVTLLKPLHGMEPLLERNLESFFRQDYPEFELIFGLRNASDPALSVVKALQSKYPAVNTRVVLSGEPGYVNSKVYVLEKMIAAASHQYLVITDSDVKVVSGFLKCVVHPLLNSEVGLVTCLYRGVSTGGIWALLEALGMSVEMSSGVLVADWLEGMKFALGPTMATRKDVLTALGGIQVLAPYCSDDFVLGQLVHGAGRKVVLSRHVIEHAALGRTARISLLHQLRWMRSTRFSRPLGHLGSGMTFAVPFGAIGLAGGLSVGRPTLGLALLGVAVMNRMFQSVTTGWGVVKDAHSLWFCWMYPIRDLLGFILWCASFWGREIVWRGERYKLERGGRMTRAQNAPCSDLHSEDRRPQDSSSRPIAVDHLP